MATALVVVGLQGFGAPLRPSTAASLFKLALGSFFVYLGSWQRDLLVVRSVVGGIGILLLGVGAILLVGGRFLSDDSAPLAPTQVSCSTDGTTKAAASRGLGDGRGPSA